MEEIIQEFKNFSFSKLETSIYLVLLRNSELNGSQIAKALNVPRTSVYTALESLYQKGAVFMLPGEPQMYRAQNPGELLKNLKLRYDRSFEVLEKGLESLEPPGRNDQYWNIKGHEVFAQKAKEMIKSARKEVLINTNYDLRIFSHELKELGRRKVRVIVFSFENISAEGMPVELYYNPKKLLESPIKRMMLAVDNSSVMIGGSNFDGETLGTFTENPLLVSVVSEHIHHDIYLYKLEQLFKKDLVSGDIKLNSMLETDVKKRTGGGQNG